MPRSLDREGVGEDGGGVGHQQRAADALHDAPRRSATSRPRRRCPGRARARSRRSGEDREAGVVHAHPAEHVAEAAEGHHQHRGDHEVAHQHPQQVADVDGCSGSRWMPRKIAGSEISTIERVERRHEHAERRVRQRRPLVAVGRWAGGVAVTVAVVMRRVPRGRQPLQVSQETRSSRSRQLLRSWHPPRRPVARPAVPLP